ncbi:hypothetical protein BDV10DRAFT_161216 [Aspergillus recurvatus]
MRSHLGTLFLPFANPSTLPRTSSSANHGIYHFPFQFHVHPDVGAWLKLRPQAQLSACDWSRDNQQSAHPAPLENEIAIAKAQTDCKPRENSEQRWMISTDR